MGALFRKIEEIDNELEVVINSGYRDEETLDYLQVLQEEKARLLMKVYAN